MVNKNWLSIFRKINSPCDIRYIPKLNIIVPEITVNLCLGKLFAIHLPIRTPSRLVEIRARAAYYALVETLDGFIGKIINSLKENNLYDNTLIIYASDHGEQIGERDLWWKQTFYEESVKIPLIMSWKDKLPCNERRKQILNLVDLTATIVDAGEGMKLPNIDGKSFLNIAKTLKNLLVK